jgi:hypothetical protein
VLYFAWLGLALLGLAWLCFVGAVYHGALLFVFSSPPAVLSGHPALLWRPPVYRRGMPRPIGKFRLFFLPLRFLPRGRDPPSRSAQLWKQATASTSRRVASVVSFLRVRGDFDGGVVLLANTPLTQNPRYFPLPLCGVMQAWPAQCGTAPF